MSAEEIFDAAGLLDEYEGDKEMLAKMVEIFDRDCATRLPKLREAVLAADNETLMSEAHAIKGGVGNFFAKASFETAARLETMGRNQEGGADAVLQELESELQALRQALGELIRS